MIKFFRHIRKSLVAQNKMGKYFKYAIGEIILVFIGIVMALQFNNWNETRKEKVVETKFYEKLLSDTRFNQQKIDSAIVDLVKHEDLHYQLYDESRGVKSYNPKMDYRMLRWNINFNPQIASVYRDQINSISSLEVKDAFNNYFFIEETTKKMVHLFADSKKELVRPFMTENNIINTDSVYGQPKYQEIKTAGSINYKKLTALYGTPEFDQILYELKLKCESAFVWFYRLSDSNKNLESILVKILKEDYQL